MIVVLSFTVACSKCGDDVYLAGPDVPEKRAIAYYAAQYGDYPFEDIKIGSGRIAQPGRKFFFQIDAQDEKGNSLGSGTLTFLDPPFPTERWGYGIDSGEVPSEFLGAIRGMREGGSRKITLPRPTSVNAHTDFVDTNGHTVAHLSGDGATLLTVTLDHMCSPRFCSSKSYSFPGPTTVRRAREVSCR